MITIEWETARTESYCVETGYSVRFESGDRCVGHGDASQPCYAAVRDPRCTHPYLSRNHPYPLCVECGRTGVTINN